MFDIGFSELMVIGIVALLVLGPERLPKVAPTTGHLLGRLQRYVSDVKSDINREMQPDELKKLHEEARKSAMAFEGSVRSEVANVENGLSSSLQSASSRVIGANSISNTYPNFGAGAYYYNENYYFGISMPRVLSYYSPLKQGDDPTTVHRQKAHFYVTGGYMIETKSDIKIKPSALKKYVKAAPIQFDINLNLLFNNIVWAGLSFRSGDAISLNLEYQLTRKLSVGCTYDYTISRLRYSTSGSHEICIGYDFGYDIMKMKNPRYF